MKRLLFIFLLSMAPFATKSYSQASPSMTINNYSSCSVSFIIAAYDACTYTSHCEMRSFPITIASGGSQTYSDITAINTGSSGPGWHTSLIGSVTACSTAGGGWDGLAFGSWPSCVGTLGVNACVSTSNSTFLACGCTSGWQGTWSTDSYGNITVDIHN